MLVVVDSGRVPVLAGRTTIGNNGTENASSKRTDGGRENKENDDLTSGC